MPMARGAWKEWTLYCSCGSPHSPSRWTWDELKAYEVSAPAHVRGYGAADEIIAIQRTHL